ncbi:MAG: M20/M25/M40 family metallo-hydrolase, partial [Nitrospinota bacterium]
RAGGFEVAETATGGTSDGNYTAALGVPTLDGLGPVGGNLHREDEYLEVSSGPERAWLLGEMVRRLGEGGALNG